MAKVVSPLMSTEARGKVSGFIYNTWRGISYVKKFTSPAQPNTAKQLAIRALNKTCTLAWAGITAAQRAAWNAYAETHLRTDWTGNPKRVTGQNWFVSCSMALLRFGSAIVATAPTEAAPAPPTGVELANAAGDLQITFDAQAGTDKQIEIWGQGPYSTGRQPRIELARFMLYSDGEGTDPVDVWTAAAAGAYTVYVRVMDETTGLTSPWVMSSVTV